VTLLGDCPRLRGWWRRLWCIVLLGSLNKHIIIKYRVSSQPPAAFFRVAQNNFSIENVHTILLLAIQYRQTKCQYTYLQNNTYNNSKTENMNKICPVYNIYIYIIILPKRCSFIIFILVALKSIIKVNNNRYIHEYEFKEFECNKKIL